jgi:hypothetical protein
LRAATFLVSRLVDAASSVRGLTLARWDSIQHALVPGRIRAHVRNTSWVWLRFWTFVKRTWLRALGGFFIATVVLAACYWPVKVLQSWQIADRASATRTWPSGRILNDVIVEAQTKCSDSALTYVLVLLPPKSNASTLAERADKAKVVTDRLRERLEPIHLLMVDKDGTPTVSHTVPVDEFVRIYSSDEERLATLEARGTIPCDSANYLRAESLTVSSTERP